MMLLKVYLVEPLDNMYFIILYL